MSHPRLCSGIATLLLIFSVAHDLARAQTSKPATSTSLNANPTSLTYPGTVTLTSTVTPTNAPGVLSYGVPSGNISFSENGTAIGSGALSLVPSTQNFVLQNLSVGGSLALVAGDFSGDKVPDLAVSGLQSGVVILQGPALGFPFLTHSTPLFSLVLGDFNGDGNPDLAGADRSSKTTVLLNTGSQLSLVPNTPTFCPSFGCQEWFATADFDGSGTSDLVVSTSLHSQAQSSSVNLLLSTYDSSTQTLSWKISPVMLPPSQTINGITYSFFPSFVATGRFSPSGHADLLVIADLGFFDVDIGFHSAGSYLLLYEGDGRGHLGDGKGSTGPAAVVFLPIADQSLQGAVQAITSIVVGDVNGDKISDVVLGERDSVNGCSSKSSSEWFRVLLGDGTGGFTLKNNSLAQFTQGSCGAPSVILGDFNNDGALDIFATSETSGNTAQASLLLNAGGGSWQTPLTFNTQEGLSPVAADFNQDGYIDIAVADPNGTSVLYDSGSAQATLSQVALPAGTYQVTASFAGDIDYSPSTSGPVTVSIAQALPAVFWPPPSNVPFGTVLGPGQLNAAANVPGTFIYSPPPGTVLDTNTPPYKQTLTVAFTPTDTRNYHSAVASVVIGVTPVAPVLSNISPNSANIGAGNTVLTLTGTGFYRSAVVNWNGTALPTTFVSPTGLTAIVSSSLLQIPGPVAVNVLSGGATSASLPFTIKSPTPVVSFQGPSSSTPAQQPTLSFAAQSYPASALVNFALTFVPSTSPAVDDPNIQFASGGRSYSQPIPANSNVNINLQLQTGTVAGVITVRARITVGGVDVTPASLSPVVIVINATVPNINGVVITRSGTNFQVAITGYSNTRELTQAEFHFNAAPGHTLKTTDVTVPAAQLFSTWYQNGASDQFGSAFLYTQPFIASGDSEGVASVSVTLTNSQGTSNPAASQ